MGKKKFEELEYDPIEAEAKRALARAVSQPGVPDVEPVITPVANSDRPPASLPKDVVEEDTRKPTRSTTSSPGQRPAKVVERKEKKRSFSCANSEQDRELDGFIRRIQDMSGTHVSFQVLLRAACISVLRAEEQIVQELRKTPPPPQPATFQSTEYAQFEEYWIETIATALRKVRPLQ
jgi:hypothetical protein